MEVNNNFKQPIYSSLTTDINGLDTLAELALDLRWAWCHDEDDVWRQLDPDLWELTHNPWVVLQTVSKSQFGKVMDDPDFRNKIEALVLSTENSKKKPAWFQLNYPNTTLHCVAYFSLEFMLSEALPIYSGGLGNVAGDQLKAASDLGVPVIGIGLLYQQGYFRQLIDKNGNQQALYPFNDPGQLPITPLRLENGELLRLKITLPGQAIWLRAWQVQVGRIKLYLLDSNDAANSPIHRGITSELYGGGAEMRLKQELLLGIGGWRLLEALKIEVEVCHLNEGHAAFAILERAANFMEKTGLNFDTALSITRKGNLFTTHTAVGAGFDLYSPKLIEQYLSHYALQRLGITTNQLLALGRKEPKDELEMFNMAYLAVRGSGAVNGVSRLHGEVSRRLFSSLFPKWPISEIPVKYITNGVHMPTWDSKEADDIWTEYCGKDRWSGTNNTLEQDIRNVSDERLWNMRINANKTFVKFASELLSRQLLGSGYSQILSEKLKFILDPHILTLGFARRFATYKRPNLLLHDQDRLLKLLTNTKFPIQLIISGKAHPSDEKGQEMIKEWIQFIQQNHYRLPVIFLSDYDMQISENLVQGVDVWINTPRRPWEASGTSGMKVLVNGGINISELDGWWAEAYNPSVGWALGDGLEHGDDPSIDAIEADQLYTILEKEIIPEFYTRNEKGIPKAWVTRMRESMAQLTPKFSADRSVREYTDQHYIKAAEEYSIYASNNGKKGEGISKRLQILKEDWTKIQFGEFKIISTEEEHHFEIQLFFSEIDPLDVKVELFCEGLNGANPLIQEMKRCQNDGGVGSGVHYTFSTSTLRPASDYTPRVIPNIKGLSVPLETNLILWQR